MRGIPVVAPTPLFTVPVAPLTVLLTATVSLVGALLAVPVTCQSPLLYAEQNWKLPVTVSAAPLVDCPADFLTGVASAFADVPLEGVPVAAAGFVVGAVAAPADFPVVSDTFFEGLTALGTGFLLPIGVRVGFGRFGTGAFAVEVSFLTGAGVAVFAALPGVFAVGVPAGFATGVFAGVLAAAGTLDVFKAGVAGVLAFGLAGVAAFGAGALTAGALVGRSLSTILISCSPSLARC